MPTSPILTWWKAEKEAITLWESVQICGSDSVLGRLSLTVVRALTPFMRAPPSPSSNPNLLPKTPPPDPITRGVSLQHMIVGGHKPPPPHTKNFNVFLFSSRMASCEKQGLGSKSVQLLSVQVYCLLAK